MTLVLVLSAMGAGAQTYTVTLKAGAGTGSDVTISNADAANVATSQSAAHNGQFWQEGDEWLFKYPDCPSTFSSPDEEKILMGWNGAGTGPGTIMQITDDMTLTAYWDIEEFNVPLVTGNSYYRVTSTSPLEVKIKRHISTSSAFVVVIPATVEHNGKNYSVTGMGENTFSHDDVLTSIEFPASIKNIEDNAFEDCRNLATVTLHSNPTIGEEAFPDNEGLTVTMTLPANPANGAYWTTFYNGSYSFQADENTKVYKAKVEGMQLKLHEVGDKIVKGETPVILKSSVDHIVMTRTTSSGEWSDNDLWGCNERTLRTDLLGTGNAVYVLGMVNSVMGFYEYTGEYMPANKAYVVAPAPSAGAPTRGLSFVEEEVTNIESVDSGQLTVDSWYTLSGVKLEGEPTERGVYIHNGRKEVVR